MLILVIWSFSSPVNARDYSPAGVAKSMGIKPIEEYAYSDDKGGCGNKAALFFVVSERYKSGDTVEQVANIKMFQPIIEGIYSKIRKNGITQTSLNNLKEYSSCIEKAKARENPEREYDLSLKHDACKKLNDVILYTVNSIKNRKKINSVFSRYSKSNIDLYGTNYEKIEDAEMLFIGELYKISKDKGFSDVVNTASNITIGCFQ